MDLRRIAAAKITTPLVPFLSRLGISPDILTWIGLLITAGAAAAIAINYLLLGGLLILFSGLFDILDGALARYSNKSTVFGALLDSTFDRLSGGITIFGFGDPVFEWWTFFGNSAYSCGDGLFISD